MQFELCYTTVLAMLELGGVPLSRKIAAGRIRWSRRRTVHVQPGADGGLLRCIAVGEGEEVVHEISDVVADWKATSETRRDLLWRLSELEGVYIPSLFKPRYSETDARSSPWSR